MAGSNLSHPQDAAARHRQSVAQARGISNCSFPVGMEILYGLALKSFVSLQQTGSHGLTYSLFHKKRLEDVF